MPCKEQALLLTVYRAKVSAYSASVNDLTLTRGRITFPEYSRLLAASEKARRASETARLALTEHASTRLLIGSPWTHTSTKPEI